MTYSSFFAILLALLLFASSTLAQQKGRKRAVAAPQSEPQATREQETERPASKSEERAAAASRTEDLAPLLSLPLEERIRRLHEIVERSDSASSALVREARTQLMRAYIERGRALLAANATEGVAALERAIDVAPEEIADEIFLETIAQIPPLLFARAQQTKALQAARRIETKFNASPAKLLTVAAFHLSVESADDAARVAERAIEIAPTLSAGYQALGAARRLQLRLDDAVAAYRRAVELEKSRNAKRSLADLLRAIGKPEEALPLYRELIAENSRDTAARAGSVLSLFEMGKRDQAEREMEAALGEETRNLALLAGAAYWYAANGEAARAVEFARRAIEIEPRYTWAQIALARALVLQRRPLEAERALRFARQYGNFPTLDYELATALAAAGLYEEAAAELARSFKLSDEQIETRLAGRIPARAASFTELLAPEVRAGLFQTRVADASENASRLKGLLAFQEALGTASEAQLRRAAEAFAEGTDDLRLFRRLYVATRLLGRGLAYDLALEMAERATGDVEAALASPVAHIAWPMNCATCARAPSPSAQRPNSLNSRRSSSPTRFADGLKTPSVGRSSTKARRKRLRGDCDAPPLCCRKRARGGARPCGIWERRWKQAAASTKRWPRISPVIAAARPIRRDAQSSSRFTENSTARSMASMTESVARR